MKTWLAIWIQAYRANRYLVYVMPLWLVAEAAVTIAYYPVCTLDRHSVSGVMARCYGFFATALGTAPWAAYLVAVDALSPAMVQLVPGLRRQAAIATVIFWLVMSAVLAMSQSMFGVPFPFVLMSSAAALALLASPADYRVYTLLPSLALLVGVPFAPQRLFAALDDLAPSKAWDLAAVVCAAGAAWISWQFQGPAERRIPGYLRAKKNYASVRTGRNASAWSAMLLKPRIYDWVFERILRIETPDARALYGLGPSFHFSQALLGGPLQIIIGGTLFYGLGMLVLGPIVGLEALELKPPLAGIAGLVFFSAFQLRETHLRDLWQRRREEALLVLLPGAPSGPALNRFLMLYLLAQYITAVACSLALITAFMLANNESVETALRTCGAAFGASLLAAPGLLRDYARMKQRRPTQVLVMAVFGFILQTIISVRPLDMTAGAVIVVTFVLSAALTVERYRRFAEAPPAFPVGRLAEEA